MKKFIITEDLAQNILNFLSGFPYKDVYHIVQSLQSVEPLDKDVVIEIPNTTEAVPTEEPTPEATESSV